MLWRPSVVTRDSATIARYMQWLVGKRGLEFGSYADLWRWSVEDTEGFWASIWDFFEVRASAPFERVLADRRMPGASWFPGAELSYAEHALRRRDNHPALISASETRGRDTRTTVTYAELARQVASARTGLQELGVKRGDRVVGYVSNIPESVVGFLAAASLGAVWSSCSPDFGTRAVVERFRQVEPKVLLAVDGYRYNGRDFDRLPDLAEIQQSLPTLSATVLIPYLRDEPDARHLRGVLSWDELCASPGTLAFDALPFDHPLWVLYSSGTTGLPKGLVHSQGGILLEHLKSLALHQDIGPDDRFFWFTTTGWMMWNYLVGGLLVGSTIVLYDGSPNEPDLNTLWRLADETQMTFFGTSAPFIQACMKAGITPGLDFDLGKLKAIGSTAAPLPPEGFAWILDAIKPDVLVGSMSGGTDMCTAFVQSCPLLPVRAGELQCRALGARVEAYDEAGQPVVGQVGELVIAGPMPSMPIYFWNDPDGRRYRESYFEIYPGVWRHGDWIEITEEGGAVIYGRSDSTLNRGGVRMGTSEFYRVVEELPEVEDSLVVDLSSPENEGRLILFVALAPGTSFDDELRARIEGALRRQLSPRHVPDEIHVVGEIPRTLNGKKLEVPVKRILTGTPLDQAVSRDAVTNAGALRHFADLAARG
jgi:acetoacetyl-CoA synthetase